jgi:hypothetical protein
MKRQAVLKSSIFKFEPMEWSLLLMVGLKKLDCCSTPLNLPNKFRYNGLQTVQVGCSLVIFQAMVLFSMDGPLLRFCFQHVKLPTLAVVDTVRLFVHAQLCY